MSTPQTPAQAAQQNNRDAGGRYQHKTHAEAEVDLTAPAAAPVESGRDRSAEMPQALMDTQDALNALEFVREVRAAHPQAHSMLAEDYGDWVERVVNDADGNEIELDDEMDEAFTELVPTDSVVLNELATHHRGNRSPVVLDDIQAFADERVKDRDEVVSDVFQHRLSRPGAVHSLSEAVSDFDTADRTQQLGAKVREIHPEAACIEIIEEERDNFALGAYDAQGKQLDLSEDEGEGSLYASDLSSEVDRSIYALYEQHATEQGNERGAWTMSFEQIDRITDERRRAAAQAMAAFTVPGR